MSAPALVPCPTCGARFEGRFCRDCGEQQVTKKDYSIAHFIGHALESLTSFDFRSLRSFITLVRHPGRLTRDYLDGRRRGYIGPAQLFVLVNVVFALSGSITFRTPLRVQEHDAPFAGLKRNLVAGAVARREMARENFQRSFDEAAELQAKTWVFAMIPALAFTTAALYGFRRYYFEHLIAATHLLAFTMVWMMASVLLLDTALYVAGKQLSAPDRDTVTSTVILAGLAVYLFVSLRRVFGDRPVAAAGRAAAVALLFFPIIVFYRFLLFFVTLLTMH